jgi:CDP-4-dehydro-6-deoxyglucose reductase
MLAMYKIKINNFNFNALGDKSIFLSAQENNILLEYSCLDGRCGSCKAKLISGITENFEFEEGLTEVEKSENFILTCVHKPKSDLNLNIEKLNNINLPAPKTIPAKISEIKFLSGDILKLTLRIPKSISFDFLPGQYIKLLKNNFKRSYSIAKKFDNKIEFFIKKYEKGLMSEYLFNHANQDDLLLMEGPFGTFFLKEDTLKNVIFLSTGTGIAPVYNMLNDIRNIDFFKERQVYLFHGARTKNDLIKYSFFSELGINYFPVLSQEICKGFYSGYIQDLCVNQNLELNQSTVYACGSNKMISAAKKKLVEFGLNMNHFYSDSFVMTN